LDNLSQEVSKNPPAPVPKRLKPLSRSPRRLKAEEGKAKGEKAAAAEGAEGAKAEKKPAKKSEGRKQIKQKHPSEVYAWETTS